MPLPKSVLCSACDRTYPEGWIRCPYCGHDAMRVKREAAAQRRLREKLRARGQALPEEAAARPGRGARRRPGRPPEAKSVARGEGQPQKKGQRPPRGAGRPATAGQQPQAGPPHRQQQQQAAQVQGPQQPQPEGKGRRRRRRGRGRGGAGAAAQPNPQQSQQSQAAPSRPPRGEQRPAEVRSETPRQQGAQQPKEGSAKKRFRRRRRRGSGSGGQGPSNPPPASE